MKKLFLLTLAALLLVGCSNTGESIRTLATEATTTVPNSTAATTTDSRDVIARPEKFTAENLEVRKIIWAMIKDKVNPTLTINNLTVLNAVKYENEYILRYEGCPGPAIAQKDVSETILTYEFKTGAEFGPLKVFTSEREFFTLQEAVDNGFYTKEDIRNIWEIYKEKHPEYYSNRGDPSLDNPYVDNSSDPSLDLGKLLESKTCVNDRIDPSSLHANLVFEPDDPTNTGIEKLFDGIKTEADYTAAGTGVLRGKAPELSCFLFDMTEKVKLSAYVITTGNDVHAHTEQNPVAWHLYATNDADAAAAMRGTDAHYEEIIRGNDQWIDLDYVWDGQMTANSFCSNGYVIDESMQGEYQYYCWVIEYANGTQIQVAELELYTD